MTTTQPADLKLLAKRIVELEKESLYSEKPSDEERLKKLERLLVEESKRSEDQ